MSNFYQDDGRPANGMKVCLATTAYESPDAAYTFSIQKTREAMHRAGIETAYFMLSGNCHVDDARNSVVQAFLESDCTDLVFLDADVVWEPESLIQLCQYDADIVGGVYPFRREGSAETMPVLMYPGEAKPNEQGLIEVAGLPTGFMRIKRHVLEKLAETANKTVKGRTTMPILFERTFFDNTRLGGDLSFCKKWIMAGGQVWAAPELRLGHVAKTVLWDSLAASMRRKNGETLKYLADHLKAGKHDVEILREARRSLNNPWGALEDVLLLCAVMGKQAAGDIIEAGSGLTSIVLAASTEHKVYSLEHDPKWADETRDMAKRAGVDNLEVVLCPIVDGWYQVPDSLPRKYALGVNDGPPRTVGSRMGFFKHFDADSIICDDADDPGYAQALTDLGRRIDFVERAAVIR